ncbi:MAG: UvrD-helicase domain-containing protein, partial [Clostridiales bacterium]|nr:UvrD-helicase domain-containing protein [Clostridiales bacterium]
TVHSFCNRLIRTHFSEIGIDPSFRIGEEGEMLLLRQKAMEDLLEEAYDSGRSSFLQFVEAYAPGKNDGMIENIIEETYRFSRGFPDAGQWFDHLLESWKQLESPEEILHAPALERILESAEQTLRDVQAELENGLAYFTGYGEEPERFLNLLRKDAEIARDLLEATDYEERRLYFANLSFPTVPRATKKEKEWPYLEEIKAIHKDVKEKVTEIGASCFAQPITDICEENHVLRPFLEELIALTKRYEELYFQSKQEKNVYDFDDLEHLALKLLVNSYDDQGCPQPSATADEMAGKYKAIFVDEYQDTNMVQETLLGSLCREGQNELFVVGDVKQSIYRFRQARPDLFLSRYRTYEGEQSGTQNERFVINNKRSGTNIELRDNFRSAPAVLSFCNAVFRELMAESFGGVDYTEDIELRPGENGPMADCAGSAQIMALIEDEEEKQLDSSISSLQAETAMIAAKMKDFSQKGYSWKDMVILLRSDAGRGEQMADYLNEAGIPAMCESKTGYFQTREVQIVLNYLAVVDNVYQDIPMASVLLSVIGGLSQEELARLKVLPSMAMRAEYTLYDLMQMYLAEYENDEGKGSRNDVRDPLYHKLKHFLEQLSYFRQKKKEEPLHELLWEIYTKTGIYYSVQLMPEGERRKENLLLLLQKAEAYEKTVFKGLFYFLRYIEQLRTYEVDWGTASLQGEAEDVVRIMTIHKSKGLEYPVVFVSGLSRGFNMMDGNRPILFHPEMGIGMEYVNLEERTHQPSLLKKALRQQMRKENLEEELRILYVAMTRAQKELVLTGIVKKKKMDVEEAKWEQEGERGASAQEISIGKKLSAGCFMDWLIPLFDRLSVRKVHFHELELASVEKTEEKEAQSLDDWMKRDDMKVDISPVEKSFSHEYPYRTSSSWKRKYSVSELKKLSMIPLESELFLEEQPGTEEEYEIIRPERPGQQRVQAAARK